MINQGVKYGRHQVMLEATKYPFLTGLLTDLQIAWMQDQTMIALSMTGYQFQQLILAWPDQASLSLLQDIWARQQIVWKVKGQTLNVTTDPLIYSILNITPDSFHDGSEHIEIADILERIEHEQQLGAKIFELGGKSSRPGAVDISATEEWDRIAPFISAIKQRFPDVILAVDTNTWSVMEQAIQAGVDIINDIDGFDTAAKRQLLFESEVGAVMMHSNREAPPQKSLFFETSQFFEKQFALFKAAGIDLERVCIDAGVGFSYQSNPYENIQRMQATKGLMNWQRPIMIAISRKKFLKTLFGYKDSNSEIPSTFLASLMIDDGARIIRTHDVASVQRMLKMRQTYYGSSECNEFKTN